MISPAERFSNRAQLYAKYRPGYPPGVVDVLRQHVGLTGKSIIADIGSGTGISTRLLAPHAALVFAVEPNAEMRAEAEREEPSNVVSADGTAEATGLVGAAVDLVVAATAFHWFVPDPCRREFRRILKPGGWVVLMWNMRQSRASALVEAYERLLHDYGTNYTASLVSDRWNVPAEEFLGAGKVGHATLPNHQEFDYEGLQGRLLSASYAPLPGHPNYEPMMARLREIFEANQMGGIVRFDYETQVYWGRV